MKKFLELSLRETRHFIEEKLKEYKGETTFLKSAGDKKEYKRLRTSKQKYENMIEEKRVVKY